MALERLIAGLTAAALLYASATSCAGIQAPRAARIQNKAAAGRRRFQRTSCGWLRTSWITA